MQRRTASPGAARIAKQHHRRRLRLQPFQQLCVLLAQGRLRRIICYCRGIGFSAAAARWSRWASASLASMGFKVLDSRVHPWV